MEEQQAQELWIKNLTEYGGYIRLDSIIIKTILEFANNKSSQFEQLVRLKIAGIIDEMIMENNGVMSRVLSMSKEKTVTWYEHNMCNIKLEELKTKLAESNFSA